MAAITSAFLAWNSNDVGSLATVFFLCSGTIGIWGLWEARTPTSVSLTRPDVRLDHIRQLIVNLQNDRRGQAHVRLHLRQQERRVVPEEKKCERNSSYVHNYSYFTARRRPCPSS